MASRSWSPLFLPLTVDVLLPLAAYYGLRAQGVAPWQALLLSGVIPAAHAVVTAVRRRRAEFFDLFVVALLAVSAATSLISGDPRVLLLKDAALPAVLGLWILGSLLAARPFAFQFGSRLRAGPATAEAERAWREVPEYREALRGLTVIWAGGQLLDAALTVIWALFLPVDVVPLLGRFQSIGLLVLVAVVSVRRSRAFRDRHGLPLFGARPAPAIPAPEEPEARQMRDAA
ncbi:VC0807 family protein [Streptomyces sp. NPDC049577]|uniref:VC0807 family protein n=1 Tax=Streptomyces sp. NPDC049577 TaxID=3155153 RepID=UPI0034361507